MAAAACVQNYGSGNVVSRAPQTTRETRREKDVQKLLRSDDGRKALEHAVQIEAKELLAQPVVQGYMKVARRENLVNLGWGWVLALLVLLLQLLFVLPLVALVPPLYRLLKDLSEDTDMFFLSGSLPTQGYYLLHLPVVKFGLECAADLALALALTLIPAADLATAPVAPLLLVWVGSGLLWEARQVMAFSSDAKSRQVMASSSSATRLSLFAAYLHFAATRPLSAARLFSRDTQSRLASLYGCLVPYWGDSINRGAHFLVCSARRVHVNRQQ